MAKMNLKLVVPPAENPTVEMPRRKKNAEYRPREYLTPSEVAALVEAAKGNRNGHRDALMILMAYRHAFRVSELTDLRWGQIDFDGATLHVRRLKGSKDSVHPIQGDELRALRKLRRDNPHAEFVFLSERKAPFSTDGVQKIIGRLAEKAGLTDLKPHPHSLRHAAGYKLAGDAEDTRAIAGWMGHANLNNAAIYQELSPDRFKKFKKW